MQENYEETNSTDETISEEESAETISEANAKSLSWTEVLHDIPLKYIIFGFVGLLLILITIAILSSLGPQTDRLSAEQVQTRTEQIAEIKNTSAVIIELVSDDRYPELERSISETPPLPVYDYNLISPENPTGLVEVVEEEVAEPEPEFFEPSMTFRAKIKVPDLEKVAQLDLSENARIDIPQKEQEIILKVDLYTKVHNGTLDDLAPDTIIQASFAKSVLSDQETHYAREITILK